MSTRRSAIRRRRLTWPFRTILTRGASPLQYLTLTLMGVHSGGIAAWSLSPVPVTLVGYRASTLAFPAVAVGGMAYLVAGVFALALGVIAWQLHRHAEPKIRIRRRDARRRPLRP